MVQLQAWSADFDYRQLDPPIEQLRRTNAFQESRSRHRLLSLSEVTSEDPPGPDVISG